MGLINRNSGNVRVIYFLFNSYFLRGHQAERESFRSHVWGRLGQIIAFRLLRTRTCPSFLCHSVRHGSSFYGSVKKHKTEEKRRRGGEGWRLGVITPTLKHKPAWGQAGFTKGQDVVDLYRNHTEEMSVNFLSLWHPSVSVSESVCLCVFPHNPPATLPTSLPSLSLGLLTSQRLTVALLSICTHHHGNHYTSKLGLLFWKKQEAEWKTKG